MLTRRLVLGAGLVSVALAVRAGAEEWPKYEKVDGHVNAVAVEVTFKVPARQKVSGLLTGASKWKDGSVFASHSLSHVEGANKAESRVWLDTLSRIKDTSDEGATAVLKDGSEVHLGFGGDSQKFVIIHNVAGSRSVVDLEDVEEVRFSNPARRDAEKNVLFDHWKYSPFTGEKIPARKPPAPREQSAAPERSKA